ncbi:MAG: hypothetical protein P8168_15265 [Deltaproteobacteria bacterium]
MKKVIILVFILVSLIIASQALAMTITFDFEDLYPGYEGQGILPANYQENSGFKFGSTMGQFWAWNTKYESSDMGMQNGTIGHVSACNPTAPGYASGFGLCSYEFGFKFHGAYITTTTNDYNNYMQSHPYSNGVPVKITYYKYPPLMPKTGHTTDACFKTIFLTDQAQYFNFDNFGAISDISFSSLNSDFTVIIDNITVESLPANYAPIPSSILLFSTGLGCIGIPFSKRLIGKK